MFYRFKCGKFVEADDFDSAKKKFIEQLETEQEVPNQWHRCKCLGMSHRYDCPEMKGVVSF